MLFVSVYLFARVRCGRSCRWSLRSALALTGADTAAVFIFDRLELHERLDARSHLIVFRHDDLLVDKAAVDTRLGELLLVKW